MYITPINSYNYKIPRFTSDDKNRRIDAGVFQDMVFVKDLYDSEDRIISHIDEKFAQINKKIDKLNEQLYDLNLLG